MISSNLVVAIAIVAAGAVHAEGSKGISPGQYVLCNRGELVQPMGVVQIIDRNTLIMEVDHELNISGFGNTVKSRRRSLERYAINSCSFQVSAPRRLLVGGWYQLKPRFLNDDGVATFTPGEVRLCGAAIRIVIPSVFATRTNVINSDLYDPPLMDKALVTITHRSTQNRSGLIFDKVDGYTSYWEPSDLYSRCSPLVRRTASGLQAGHVLYCPFESGKYLRAEVKEVFQLGEARLLMTPSRGKPYMRTMAGVSQCLTHL